ncbi:MAG TPA: carboxypeptidase-like regulatory domain-containing protein [Chloroflexota bacterium]|nr:carboxypeptidase-like regulatory domain-containing protein [Chloroflexota bacterium]
MRYLSVCCLAVLLAACGSSSAASSTSTVPSATPYSRVHAGKAPQTKTKKQVTPLPTLKPGVTAVLPTVKPYVPKTPTPFPASDYRSLLYGTVRTKSGKPLAHAKMVIQNGQRVTYTDASGAYHVGFPSQAAVSVQPLKAGYACAVALGLLHAGEHYKLNFTCAVNTPSHPAPPPFPTTFGHHP